MKGYAIFLITRFKVVIVLLFRSKAVQTPEHHDPYDHISSVISKIQLTKNWNVGRLAVVLLILLMLVRGAFKTDSQSSILDV